MRSRILDAGQEDMLIFPEVEVTNKRGESVIVPADVPVKIRVTTSVDRSADAELPGQVSSKVMRVLARSAPVGSWAGVEFRGERWDLASPPRFTRGVSRATRHVEFMIRSTNNSGGHG